MSSKPDFYLSRKGTVIVRDFREPFILFVVLLEWGVTG